MAEIKGWRSSHIMAKVMAINYTRYKRMMEMYKDFPKPMRTERGGYDKFYDTNEVLDFFKRHGGLQSVKKTLSATNQPKENQMEKDWAYGCGPRVIYNLMNETTSQKPEFQHMPINWLIDHIRNAA